MKLPPNPFPTLEQADPDGLLAIGGNYSPQLLLLAYLNGIFPWPFSPKDPIAWFSPNPRGVIFTHKLHIPKSLKRFLNNHPYEIKYNTNFEAVIKACSQVPRPNQKGTWITKELINAYIQLFSLGYAYSVEIYEQSKLIAGLYGVCINHIISGESMFYTKPNTSKLALVNLIQKLNQAHIPFLDTQMITPVTKQLGAEEISREEFINSIKNSSFNLNRENIFQN